MRFITRKRLDDFIRIHPEARASMDRWYDIVKRAEFDNFNSLKSFFPNADLVENFVIFNVGGNHFRVAAFIAYTAKIIYIRHVMTHDEYSKNLWKQDPWFKRA